MDTVCLKTSYLPAFRRYGEGFTPAEFTRPLRLAIDVQWTDKFSTYAEGEVRGRPHVLGYAGRVAARYTF